jgi:hypothetical protein
MCQHSLLNLLLLLPLLTPLSQQRIVATDP